MVDLSLTAVAQAAVSPSSPGNPYSDGMAIAAGSSFATGVFANPSQATIAVGAVLSTPGTLSLQRYVDSTGLIPQGSPSTLALSAGVGASITIGDGSPFLAYSVTVTPANGSAATLTKLAITLRAKEVFGGDASLPFVLDLILAEMRIQSMFTQALINGTESLANLRRDQLTELGSLAVRGLGS